MELVKTTIKLGNSAGILLPKKYLNSQVKIILEPLNIEKDVLNILMDENILEEVMGIYLTGSYSRGEQNIESDIDVLVITNDINKRIVKEKYELICLSKKELEKQLENNALPILPMIKEAKVILNKDLLKNYVDVSLTKKNLKWYVETTKSRTKDIREDIKLYKKANEKYMSDNFAYILVLRLRTIYIIDCIRKNKICTKKEFLKLIKKTSGSLDVYDGYLRSKNNQKTKKELPLKQTEKLIEYIDKNVAQLEKWLS